MKRERTPAPPRTDAIQRRAELPMQTRLAALQTVDADKRTVELVWSTGARVRRRDWWTGKPYDEELSLDPSAVDLGRMNNGAPLLSAHNAYEIAGVIGVVERAWIEKSEGRALVRFSDRDDVAPVFADVRAGILRNVSVGYRVGRYEITEEEGKPPLWRAVAWEPVEVSLVPVGADAGAGTRAAAAATYPCEFINRASDAPAKETVMTKIAAPAGESPAETLTQTQTQAIAPPAPAPDPAPDADSIRRAAVEAERRRGADIRARVRAVQLPDTFADDMVARGVAAEHAGNLIVDELARRGGPAIHPAVVTRDENDTRVDLAVNAVMHRCQPGRVKLEEGARQYRGFTLIELARHLLEARGVRTAMMGRMALAGAAFGQDAATRGAVLGGQGTSDLANVLANVMNKTLRMQYEGAPKTFTRWARPTSNPDFKTISRTALSGAPSLLLVDQGGEFKRGAFSDGKESYQLATYGRTAAFTRQAVINDDLDALSRVPQAFGQAAADLESDTVYAVLTANAALSDGVALVHATHANLAGSGGAIAVATLDAGRAAMRVQTGPAADSEAGRVLNLAPAFIIVPAAKEHTAYQFTSSQFVPAKTADINEYRAGGRTALEPIVEPRLDASSTTAWYLAADPARIDTVEYCYLEGNEGVFTETRVGFEVDGVEIKVRHDFAAKAIDHRGLYKNAGA